jgi:hypothetical protein
MTTDTDRFLAYLRAACTGRDRAMSAACLHVATGITPRRQQEIILELDAQGIDVCSACDRKPYGYFIPASEAELAPFLHQLRQRRNALSTRVKGIEGRHPALRETRKVTPPLRIEPSGKPEQAQLELVS